VPPEVRAVTEEFLVDADAEIVRLGTALPDPLLQLGEVEIRLSEHRICLCSCVGGETLEEQLRWFVPERQGCSLDRRVLRQRILDPLGELLVQPLRLVAAQPNNEEWGPGALEVAVILRLRFVSRVSQVLKECVDLGRSCLLAEEVGQRQSK